MKRIRILYPLFLFLLFASTKIKAQEIYPLSLEAFENQCSVDNDTLYVINFWATWCIPCVKELPHFLAFKEAHQSAKIKFIFISLDDPDEPEDVKAFLLKKGHKMDSYIISDGSPNDWIEAVSKDWSGAIPATILINNQENVREFKAAAFTEEELHDFISPFFNNKTTNK